MTHRILIVEDDKHFAAQLKELFDYHGLEARVAVTGTGGIEDFERFGADLVLIDVMLPQVHGLRVLEAIREFEGGADVPAILMSAVYRNESLFARDIARLGVHGFLPKPFSLIDLGRKVNGILDQPEKGRAAVRELLEKGKTAPPPTPAPAARTPARATALDQQTASQPAVEPARPRIEATGAGALDPGRYVRLLTHLFHSHVSGILRLQQGGDETALYLLNGYPVWVDTGRAADLLEWLVGEGVLAGSDLASLRHLETPSAMRAALLDQGLLTADSLPPLMEAWVGWQIRSRLLAASGSFVFDETDDFAGMIPVYEVNPIRELWAATGEVPLSQIEPDLAQLAGRGVGRTRSFNRLFGYIGSSSTTRELGEHLLRPRSLDDVRKRFYDDESTRCLWLLLSAGLISVADAPNTTRARRTSDPRVGTPRRTSTPEAGSPPPRPTGRFGAEVVRELRAAEAKITTPPKESPPPEDPSPPSASPEDDADPPEARVARDYVTKMELDHYAFLGVPRTASSRELDAAYQRLAPRYRLQNLGAELQPDTRRQAKELLTKLVEAFGELSEPHRRRTYDQELARAARKGNRPRGALTNPGVAPPASSEGPLSGYPSAPSNDRLTSRRNDLGDQAFVRWQQARRAITLGEHRRAFSVLEGLRTELPAEAGVLADMAWCRLHLGLPSDPRTQDKALEWVELAVAFDPGDEDVIEVKARILAVSTSHGEAVRALTRLQRRNRDDLPWVRSYLSRHQAKQASEGDGKGRLSGLFGRRK